MHAVTLVHVRFSLLMMICTATSNSEHYYYRIDQNQNVRCVYTWSYKIKILFLNLEIHHAIFVPKIVLNRKCRKRKLINSGSYKNHQSYMLLMFEEERWFMYHFYSYYLTNISLTVRQICVHRFQLY